jgi:hypothetical protein
MGIDLEFSLHGLSVANPLQRRVSGQGKISAGFFQSPDVVQPMNPAMAGLMPAPSHSSAARPDSGNVAGIDQVRSLL